MELKLGVQSWKPWLLRYSGCLFALAFVVSLIGYRVNYGYSLPGLLAVAIPTVLYFGFKTCRFWVGPLIVAAFMLQPVFSPVMFVLMSNVRLALDPPDFSGTKGYGTVETVSWGNTGLYSSSTDLQLLFSENGDEAAIQSAYHTARLKSDDVRTELKWINPNYYLIVDYCC
ncbi:hypothetical protein PsW64_05104 [Pseudovibrio sp. W64]|uniref:hypothetical protein n=1 Tax=unclassified Pseudovibrio TaxID=2627060 RepID=UPI0007AE65FD|nr:MULTISPECIES: hypothetical protein [unclassified Pseudovibrio]KZK76376.1 hypothetical protein PsW64_05104 [Pseudovibrio sp. W64]KZK80018.1 hypothetical protein PsAD46_04006 [Pseudovibrio sp. Ad46]